MIKKACLLAIILATGCSTPYTLDMAPSGGLGDYSSASPNLQKRGYQKFIVLPASGVGGGEYNNLVADMERELLRRGRILISSAVTGKIVKEPGKDEGGKALTDTERALVMAKSTGADAVLQIGVVEWSQMTSAWFILDRSDKEHRHELIAADPKKFESWPGPKLAIAFPTLTVTARLLDVETGELMASFKYQSSAAQYLPEDYIANYSLKGNAVVRTTSNYVIGPEGVVWAPAKRKVVTEIVNSIAQRMVGGRPGE